MRLHIFDVKQLMYIGQSKGETVCRGIIQDQGRFRPNEMRVGSICYMFEKMNALRRDPSDVLCFCCDSKPLFKMELLDSVFHMRYKQGRPGAPLHVSQQYDFAIDLLRQMNFNVFKEDEYEADDLISSLVYKYKDVFDEVIIYTNDSDQYYLIDNKVRCEAVSNNVRSVNMSGYVEACSKKRHTPYNRVMLDKMLYGEPGDNVPQLGPTYVEAVDKCVPEIIYPYFGNSVLLRTIIKALSQDDERAMCVCDMIIPRLLLDERVSIATDKLPDWNLFTFYAIAFGCSTYRGFELPINDIGEATILNQLDKING